MPVQCGYYRFPSIHGDRLVFACEDDVWSVGIGGGSASRLSANPGRASHPVLSPDGTLLAYSSQDEGAPEVYVMPAAGAGPARRLTFLGASTRVVGWRPDGSTILFASDAQQPFQGDWHLWEVSPGGGAPEMLPLGPALSISFAPDGGGVVLNRNGGGRRQGDPAWWKRYRGGTAGQMWIDARGTGAFRRPIELEGDVAAPMWIGRRIYFLSDHEGVGNLYSCTPTGRGLRRHTDHEDYYARGPKTDGARIVYTAGADLYVLEPDAAAPTRVEVTTASTRPQRNRKFVSAARFLQHYALHPAGHSLCLTTRGRPFTFAHWEGPVVQHGQPDGVRYRFAQWLRDGKRLIAVTDESGTEELVVIQPTGRTRRIRVKADLGRVEQLAVAPGTEERVAVVSHRNEVFVVDLKTRSAHQVDETRSGRIAGINWSPDGRWLAYGMPTSRTTAGLKVYDADQRSTSALTRPDFRDMMPAFDPEGRYLYFFSLRDYDPVYDAHIFALGFPRGMRLLALPLRTDLRSPFEPMPHAPGEDPAKPHGQKAATATKPEPVRIDFDGIDDRVVACPISAGRYGGLRVIPGKLLFTSFPVEGSLEEDWRRTEPAAKASLECYDLKEQKRDTLVQGLTDFEVSAAGKTLVYRKGYRLRVLQAGVKPKPNQEHGPPSRESGWIDLTRLKVSVEPAAEWAQMYHEAWRLQRDHFWTADMSGVDWAAVRERYLPLLDRVACRSEFSDLMWEMQGELGTSHAYEMGGDYRPQPPYRQGFLGADLAYDARAKTWRVARIPRGDSWRPQEAAPLVAPGVNLKPRDRIVAVGGRKVGAQLSPGECLVNQAGQDVQLTVADRGGRKVRTVHARTLREEHALRYRDWVDTNRAHVHAETDGRVGYIHIPDMGPWGFAEFYRYFVMELDRPGLIIDARYNRGGHVSQLLLEKLLLKRVGYDVSRWMVPEPYPAFAPMGPMVALTNEHAGSDGDMFSHAFKVYGLGPLIGTRTWGGVIGISPRHALVDGTLTTQPEYSFWFADVGYGVENYGTDPDIEVAIAPQDYAAGTDPQMARALSEIRKLLRRAPGKLPDFSQRPKLPSAKLPKRTR